MGSTQIASVMEFRELTRVGNFCKNSRLNEWLFSAQFKRHTIYCHSNQNYMHLTHFSFNKLHLQMEELEHKHLHLLQGRWIHGLILGWICGIAASDLVLNRRRRRRSDLNFPTVTRPLPLSLSRSQTTTKIYFFTPSTGSHSKTVGAARCSFSLSRNLGSIILRFPRRLPRRPSNQSDSLLFSTQLTGWSNRCEMD